MPSFFIRSLSIRSLMFVFAITLALNSPRAEASALLDQKAQALQTLTGAPGIAVAVFSTNDFDQGAAGVRKLDSTALMTGNEQFHLGSNLKAMTAITIATMVEAGQLTWNAKLRDLLPEQAASMRPEYLDKTLLDLLTHKAGVVGVLDLPAILALPSFSGNPRQQRAEFTAWALTQTPDIAPGADAQYSNGGLTIAASIAERVANQSYEALLSAKVLNPLAIPARFIWPATGPAATALTQPWGHVRDKGQWIPNDPNAPENQFPQFLNPAGNISMTLPEYARTVRLHLRGLRGECTANPAQIVSNQTFHFLNTPQSSLLLSPAWFVSNVAGEPTSFFNGSAGTFFIAVAIQPRLNKAVVVAINAVEESVAFETAVSDMVLGLLELPATSLFDSGFESCR